MRGAHEEWVLDPLREEPMTTYLFVRRPAALFIVLLGFVGCGDDAIAPPLDAGPVDSDAAAVDVDAGGSDSAAGLVDSGTPADASMIPEPLDAGSMGADAAVGCSVRAALPLSGEVSARLTGEGTNPSTTCTSAEGTGGPEHYYSLHLDERRLVTLRATSAARIVLAIRTACADPLSELACSVQGYGYPLGVTTVAQILEPGDYFVLVDVLAAGVGGDYTLSVSTSTPAPNGTCATAMTVTPGTPVVDQHLELGAPFTISCPRAPADSVGPTLWYSVTVPPHTRVTVTRTTSDLGPAIGIFSSCAASACLAGTFLSERDMPPLFWDNLGDAPVDVLVVVGLQSLDSAPVTFDLLVTATALPEHSSCAHAAALTPGVPATGDAFLADLYYTIRVPAGQLLRVTGGGAAFRGAGRVRIVDACASLTCLDCPPSTDAVYRNSGTTARDVIVVAGQDVGVLCTRALGCDPSFTLTAELVPLAANATCGGATALPLGGPVTTDLSAGGESLACESAGGTLRDGTRYYTAHVPAGEILHLSASNPLMGTSVGIVASCSAAATCVDRAVAYGNAPAMLAYRNSGAVAADVVVEVSVADALAQRGTAELSAQIGPPRASTACASAPAVTDGTRLVAEELGGGVDSLTAACLPAAMGRAHYYPIAVPAGQELAVIAQASATSAYGAYPVIRLLSGCGATSCLVGRQTAGASATQLTHVNTTGSTENLVVAVGTADAATSGLVDLSFSIRSPQYVISTVATSCDDMTGVPDPGSAPAGPMPFAFAFFGDAVTSYTTTPYGYAQLWTGEPPYFAMSGANQPLPALDAPPGLVAALWDAIGGARQRAATFGASPNRHLTVEWRNAMHTVDPGSSLTFQLKLYEGTNVVELHYCSMTTTVPALSGGGSATVGLQDLTQRRAALHAVDQVGAVSTAAALRFTPAP